MLSVLKKTVDFLGSLRLAIVLLIALTLASLTGVILPQAYPKVRIGIFAAPWFYCLLGALCVNIIACSTRRVRATVRHAGSLMFHLGIVAIIAGGAVGMRYGSSAIQSLVSGQTVPLAGSPYLLRCDWFRLEQNEDGSPKDYQSKLAILSAHDQTVLREKIIRVNEPLSFNGYKFYQATWGYDGTGIESARLSLAGPGISYGYEVSVPYGQAFPLQGSDLVVLLTEYVPDFVVDMESRTVSSRSDDPNNPAFKVLLLRGKDTLFNRWVFGRYPGMTRSDTLYKVSAVGMEPRYSTGIQIRKQPGIMLIWAGIVFMTISILMIFYIPKRGA
ncbi:MAG: cytochrome c biogenesis protein ResB [Chitinispirillaceae bacterium]|jgi:cytochrome c biogenesis protein|nr:cytochrome c biogenesis protein ResB [Chitinispirillaceae bacterium]